MEPSKAAGLARSRETEALSVLNLPNYRLAALSQVLDIRGGNCHHFPKIKKKNNFIFFMPLPRSPERVTAAPAAWVVWPSTELQPAWRRAAAPEGPPGASQCPAWSSPATSSAQTSLTGTELLRTVSQHNSHEVTRSSQAKAPPVPSSR